MHQFSNMPNNPIIYKDTDSLVLEKPLSEDLIGPKIGQFKLEHIIKKGIFLKPKTYAIRTDKEDVIKAAGYPNKDLTFEDFEMILKDPQASKTLKAVKLIKSLANLNITQKTCKFKLENDKGIFVLKVYMTYDMKSLKPLILTLEKVDIGGRRPPIHTNLSQ
ncbi:hypothetical protein [Clostridium sp.]|uniref:hypothetical protein n=1 Tax=Clostridium sp. TaxID=1506 RepID=UPI0028414C47|nr:hypothetical protein [Clostridium sp.]MDR3596104.1 hypothetical protein [Clostridium sp.]